MSIGTDGSNANGAQDLLSPRVRYSDVISALLSEPTIEKAAKLCQMNPCSIHRALKNHEFAKAYAQSREAVLDAAISRLSVASGRAVQTLIEILEDPKASESARITAAKTVLDFAFRDVRRERDKSRPDDNVGSASK